MVSFNLVNFCGNSTPRSSRFFTSFDVCARTADRESQARNVLVLPPEKGNADAESYEEEAAGMVASDEEAFGPAGELKVDESRDDTDEEVEPPARRPRMGQWRKK